MSSTVCSEPGPTVHRVSSIVVVTSPPRLVIMFGPLCISLLDFTNDDACQQVV